MRQARALAFESAGRSIAARIAMIAITTNNSMRVKPLSRLCAGPPSEIFLFLFLILFLGSRSSLVHQDHAFGLLINFKFLVRRRLRFGLHVSRGNDFRKGLRHAPIFK